MKARATLLQVGIGVALIITGYLASAGLTLACAVQNQALYGSAHPSVVGQGAMWPYVIAGCLALAWLAGVSVFAIRSRSGLARMLVALALVAFSVGAFNVLRFSYPVCNAF